MTELTNAALNKKIKIKGLEKVKVAKVESEIYDLQFKMHEAAEKADVEAVRKSREQDLRNLQDHYNKSVAALNQSLADKTITKQQYEMLMI